MDFNAIYHRCTDNYCYPFNENELIINIKTGNDVDEVYIHYGDPFDKGILGGAEKWNGKKENIPFKKNLSNTQVWWTTTVIPLYKRLRYFFELKSKGETWFYYEDGVISQEQAKVEGKFFQYFIYPWMNPSDLNVTPNWVNNTVWYQIFVDRFNNGDSSINPPYTKAWKNEKTQILDFYGGDIQGIINRLDYLQKLGINGIYLTPIFKSDSNHKYNIYDYMEIDEHFGNKETFKKFVNEAHKRNIKIMLDGVFNHCGKHFPMWEDVLQKGRNSKYFDWFMINKYPFDKNRKDTRDKSFYSFAFASSMPKMNTNNQEVIDYFIGVCEYWIKEFDIDAFRLDVANEVSHNFCKQLRKKLKFIKPDFYILGELWHDAIAWLRGDEFDGVMNYPLMGSICDFWVDKNLTKYNFEYNINRSYTMYMQQNNNVIFNLLDSHDTARLYTRCKGNLDEFFQHLAVLFTMPGSSCIYYGTEIAMEGSFDPDCRRCMPWNDIDKGVYDDRINEVRKLINLRKTNDMFRSLYFHFPNHINNKRVLEYMKINNNGDKILVVINNSSDNIYIDRGYGVLYSRHYDDSKEILFAGGILIKKIDKNYN